MKRKLRVAGVVGLGVAGIAGVGAWAAVNYGPWDHDHDHVAQGATAAPSVSVSTTPETTVSTPSLLAAPSASPSPTCPAGQVPGLPGTSGAFYCETPIPTTEPSDDTSDLDTTSQADSQTCEPLNSFSDVGDLLSAIDAAVVSIPISGAYSVSLNGEPQTVSGDRSWALAVFRVNYGVSDSGGAANPAPSSVSAARLHSTDGGKSWSVATYPVPYVGSSCLP